MRLGLTSAILHEMDLPQLAKFCGENRLQSLELMCWPLGSKDNRKFAGVTHVNADEVIKNGANFVHDAMGDIKISGLGYYPNPLATSYGRVYTGQIKKVIKAATILGVSVVNTFIGRNPWAPVSTQWGRVRNIWRPIISLAKDCGIKIGIENCPMRFGLDEWPGGKNLANNPVNWRRMFDVLGTENLGLNFDPSHLKLQGIDLVRAMKEFGEQFVHVHAKDLELDEEGLYNHGVLADRPKDWHTPKIPGRGQVPWPEFFAALKQVEYDGDVTIEVEDPDFETPEERQQAVILSRDFFEPFFVLPEAEVAQA